MATVETPYRVRLEGASRLDTLDVTVRVETQKPTRVYRLRHENFTPDRDFSLAANELGKSSSFLALHAGSYALARIEPAATKSPDITFLVDTSTSEPTPLPKIAGFLSAVSQELAQQKTPPLITVVGFDQDILPIVTRARAPLSREQLAPLAARGRLGGTDLQYAITGLIAQGLPHRHVVMLSDFENLTNAHGLVDDGRGTRKAAAPLADDHTAARTTPFILAWKFCESRVTFRTEIALTKHDGDVLVEVCRDKACSRGIIESTKYAAWPGSGGAIMEGDLEVWQSLDATRQQVIRNGLSAVANGGLLGEQDGETPASFKFEATLDGPAISESSTYRLRVLRRRTEVALDWSGKLAFVRTLRHPTRDPAPCLRAELEIAKARHSLH